MRITCFICYTIGRHKEKRKLLKIVDENRSDEKMVFLPSELIC
jgi:hypothetical protein